MKAISDKDKAEGRSRRAHTTEHGAQRTEAI
jgi:hypothetical protein